MNNYTISHISRIKYLKCFLLFPFSFLLLLNTNLLLAQETDSTDLKYRPVQVTFIYPLGSNGSNTNYVHRFSLNILGGINGGVEGVELATLFNANKAHVDGFQVAGLVNLTGGETSGAQLSGLTNVNGSNVRGAHITGFANVVKGSVNGAQLAGFANITSGTITGAQIAGFSNIVDADANGCQLSGFINTSKNTGGAQLTGFINVVDGYFDGFQLAGFTNIVNYDVKGAQISGFLNVAKYVKGFQMSAINICDSIDGVPFGLINVVSNGYRKFDLWLSESLYANAAFKMGVRKLYTTYAIGIQPFGNVFRWGVGLGFGTELDLNENSYLDIDLLGFHINEGESWTNTLNLLSQLKFSFGFKLSDHSSLFIGPTYNLMVSNYVNPKTGQIGSDIAPYTFYNRTVDGTNIKMWFGLNAGFKF